MTNHQDTCCECGCHTSEHSDSEMRKNGCDICHEWPHPHTDTEHQAHCTCSKCRAWKVVAQDTVESVIREGKKVLFDEIEKQEKQLGAAEGRIYYDASAQDAVALVFENWITEKLTTTVAEAVKANEQKYNELLMGVRNKFKGETRHETALRYIKNAEQSGIRAKQALTPLPDDSK